MYKLSVARAYPCETLAKKASRDVGSVSFQLEVKPVRAKVAIHGFCTAKKVYIPWRRLPFQKDPETGVVV